MEELELARLAPSVSSAVLQAAASETRQLAAHARAVLAVGWESPAAEIFRARVILRVVRLESTAARLDEAVIVLEQHRGAVEAALDLGRRMAAQLR